MDIRVKRKITALMTFVSVALPTSCAMMTDDRSDCPACRNTLRIMLRYDYNTQRANMFSDHVEEATVYVVDPATGNVVDWQTTSNNASAQPLRSPSFAFNFEGLTPGNYRLYATGRSAAQTTFITTAPKIGENIDRLQFTVPTTVNGQRSMVNDLRLDSLWNTLKPVSITVPEDEPTEATVPLMRLTNDLNIIVFRRDSALVNGHERYDVCVTDENLTLGYDNATLAATSIVYRPFAAWTTETTVSGSSSVGDSIAERNAHYDLSLFRLLAHADDARHNPRLIISNHATGHEIVNIDLCHYLALARNAYETQHYGVQEYLDREYDYRLDFGIEGTGTAETWKYMTISINVLSWAIRVQNEDL
jgi:hypothetical protein